MPQQIRQLVRCGAIVAIALVLLANAVAPALAEDSVIASPSEAAPGDTVTITATTSWTGVADFASASLTSTIPASFTNVSWTCSATNATCDAASGTGNDISVNVPVDDPKQDATVTLVITATVADDAASGPADVAVCMGWSAGAGFMNGTRALPLLQDGCPSATVTIAQPEPTPTEPAATETATTTPATPIATQTETPAPPAPTQGSGPVTQLPSTGAGANHSGPGAGAITVAIIVLGLMAIGIAGVRSRTH